MIIADALHREEVDRAPSSALAGLWCNRLGSTMELTVHQDHAINGIFHTNVGVSNPKASFSIVGFAEGDALSFCVDFGSRGSVAAWSGHHVVDERGERLVTLWHLAQPMLSGHGEADAWRTLMAGADEFSRVNSVA